LISGALEKAPVSKPPNPITQGIRAVWRDPAVFLVEILWRWSFAILACLLIFSAGLALLGPLHIGNSWDSATRSRDPQKIGQLLLLILLLLGKKVIIAAFALPIAIALVWTIISAMGRSVTVKRLRVGLTSLGFPGILALQFLRAVVALFAALLLVAAAFGEVHIATSGHGPDLLLFYLMMMPSFLLIGASWTITNWYLSLAAIFGRDGQSFRGAFRQARQTVRLQRSDFAGTGFVFLLMRLALLLLAVAICGLTSGMAGTSPQSYFVLLTVVSLAYCFVADFLYMSRMAAYLALAAAHVEPGGPKLVAVSTILLDNPTPL
jgi:hypothetical protein